MSLEKRSSGRYAGPSRRREDVPAGDGRAPRGAFGDHPAPAVVTDDRGVVLDANPSAVRLLSPGGRAALVGRRLDHRLSRDGGRELLAALRQLRRLETPAPLDVEIHRPGSTGGVPMRCTGTPLAAPGSSILWKLEPSAGGMGTGGDALDGGDSGLAGHAGSFGDATGPGKVGAGLWGGSGVAVAEGGLRRTGEAEREARLLLRATLELLTPREVVRVARRATGIAARTLADGAVLYLSDPGDPEGTAHPVAAAPLTEEDAGFGSADHPLLAEILEESSARLVSDPATLGLLFGGEGLPDDLSPPGEALFVCLPTGLPTDEGVRSPGRGMLAYLWASPGGSSGSDQILLQAFAGVVARAIVRAAEIEDARRARREAESSARGRYRALASLCHDFRAPLNAIMGYADLMLQGIPEEIPGGCRRHVERLRDATAHLAEMVSAASDLEGRLALATLPTQEISVASLVRQVGAIVEESAAAKSIDMTLPEVPDDVEIDTDPGSLRKILVNLLDNAVKYTDRGEVELDLEERDEEVIFRVRDSGRGIPPDELSHVFEPFWRGKDTDDSPRDGSGLGLSVVKDLVDRLHGRIDLESGPGEGTVVTVALPR